MTTIIHTLKKNESIWISLFFGVIGFIVFGAHRSATPLAGDEPFTLYFSQWPVGEILSKLMTESNIPLTYEILVHYWIKLTSISTSDVRLLPVLFSSLTAPALYLIGFRTHGSSMGILAAVLFVFSPIQYEWAHLLRSYSLMICATSWSITAVLYFIQTQNKRWIWIWVTMSALAVASHYLSAFAIFLSWIFLVYHTVTKKQSLSRLFIATFILLLLLSPFLFIIINRYLTVVAEGTYVEAPRSSIVFYLEIIKMLGTQAYFLMGAALAAPIGLGYLIFKKAKTNASGFPWAAICILAGLIVIITISSSTFYQSTIGENWLWFYITVILFIAAILLSAKRYSFEAIHLVFIWFLVPYVAMFFLSFKTPMFIDRYLSFTSPAIYLLLAYCIAALPKKISYGFGAAILTLAFLQRPLHPERPIRPDIIMNAFKEIHTQKDVTVWSPGYTDLPFTYYYDRAIFSNAMYHLSDTLGQRMIAEEGYTQYKEGLRRELARNLIFVANQPSHFAFNLDTVKSVVFLDAYSEYIYPNNGIKEELLRRFGEPKEERDMGNGIVLYRFTTNQ